MMDNTIGATKRTMLEEFIFGAKNGFYLGVERILPAMILAYVIILFLKMTGLMAVIGQAISPVMALFGLPGRSCYRPRVCFFCKSGRSGHCGDVVCRRRDYRGASNHSLSGHDYHGDAYGPFRSLCSYSRDKRPASRLDDCDSGY